MQKFYYNEIKEQTLLLQQLNIVMDKYSRKEMDVPSSVLHWLSDAIQFYKTQGQAEKESRLQILKAEFVTAQRNINPLTFEKVTLHKHELQSTIAFKVLQRAETLLQNDLTENKERLKGAIDLASQVIIAGFQGGIITTEMIKNIKGQHDIEALWAALSADANIALGQKRILLAVSIYDVWILMDELLANLKN
jgi:hypothetical protein